MLEVFQKWYRRYFSEEESVLLLALLATALVVLMTLGDTLTPVFVAVVLAYLMQGMANALSAWGVSRRLGVWISTLIFTGSFFAFMLGLVPLVWRQLASLVRETPTMVDEVRSLLLVLPERYPGLISVEQLNQLTATLQTELASFGQVVVTKGVSSIPSVLAILVYMVLIPMMVFFFLTDRERILGWVLSFLPNERPLLNQIWLEMNQQFANYARGKVIEIIIIGGVSYACFALFQLNYAALLALLVGLSVIIPYIGATLVTIPVVVVAYFQWGVSPDFYYVVLGYAIIQVLDGNVLVPLLFSEAVNLHPVAIIIAVLFFGGIWGVWGVFFAIPLATLVNAVVGAWPTRKVNLEPLADQ